MRPSAAPSARKPSSTAGLEPGRRNRLGTEPSWPLTAASRGWAAAGAATRAVKALATELGAALLRRTTRSVGLADAGAAYLGGARTALADLDDAGRSMAGTDGEPQGLLVLTAPVVYGPLHVVPVVAALLARHPRIDVRLTLTDRVVRLVEEGIDAAVRIGALPDSALRAVRVGEVRPVLVASPGYLAVRVAPRLVVNTVDAAIEAACLGCGIAQVLDYQARERLEAGSLRAVLQDHAPAPVPVSLVHAAGRQGSPAVRDFTAAARARPGWSRSGPCAEGARPVRTALRMARHRAPFPRRGLPATVRP